MLVGEYIIVRSLGLGVLLKFCRSSLNVRRPAAPNIDSILLDTLGLLTATEQRWYGRYTDSVQSQCSDRLHVVLLRSIQHQLYCIVGEEDSTIIPGVER